MIPWIGAAPGGLDALLVYQDTSGPHPLVVMTHGSPRSIDSFRYMSPWDELQQALWFARRGWFVIVVMRRGYAGSGGEPDSWHGGRCPQTSYRDAGMYAAEDLRAAIEYGRTLPNVDGSRVIAVGASTGGFASVALTAWPLKGLVAAINFSGGRGSQSSYNVCNAHDLERAFRIFGKNNHIPMLWLYAENDAFFWPDLVRKFDSAFRAEGGSDELVFTPPVGKDGHSLFHHIDAWSEIVDRFLDAQHLPAKK